MDFPERLMRQENDVEYRFGSPLTNDKIRQMESDFNSQYVTDYVVGKIWILIMRPVSINPVPTPLNTPNSLSHHEIKLIVPETPRAADAELPLSVLFGEDSE